MISKKKLKAWIFMNTRHTRDGGKHIVPSDLLSYISDNSDKSESASTPIHKGEYTAGEIRIKTNNPIDFCNIYCKNQKGDGATYCDNQLSGLCPYSEVVKLQKQLNKYKRISCSNCDLMEGCDILDNFTTAKPSKFFCACFIDKEGRSGQQPK